MLISARLRLVCGASGKRYVVHWDVLDRDPVPPTSTRAMVASHVHGLRLPERAMALDYLVTSLYEPQPVEAMPFDAPDFWRVLAGARKYGIKQQSFQGISHELLRRVDAIVLKDGKPIWTVSWIQLVLNMFIFHHACYITDPHATWSALSWALRLVMWSLNSVHRVKRYVGGVLLWTDNVAGRDVRPLHKAMRTLETTRANLAGDIQLFRKSEPCSPRWSIRPTRPSAGLCALQARGSVAVESPVSSSVHEAPPST